MLLTFQGGDFSALVLHDQDLSSLLGRDLGLARLDRTILRRHDL